MCYAKKIVGWDNDDDRYDQYGVEKDLGVDFDGKFHCARFNCEGCDHGLVDGQLPKRNLGLRINIDFKKLSEIILIKLKIPLKDFHLNSRSNLVLVDLPPYTKACSTELKGPSK